MSTSSYDWPVDSGAPVVAKPLGASPRAMGAEPSKRRSDKRLAAYAYFVKVTLELLAWVALAAGVWGLIHFFNTAFDIADGFDPYWQDTLLTAGSFRNFAWLSLGGGFLAFVWLHFLSIIAGYINFKTE
jgi:hypothetical protein